jgi:hypothetical protein
MLSMTAKRWLKLEERHGPSFSSLDVFRSSCDLIIVTDSTNTKDRDNRDSADVELMGVIFNIL